MGSDPDTQERSPFQRLVLARRSVREFKPDPVPEEAVRDCVEAARHAPSAENSQPWRFTAVTDPQLRARLSDAAFSGIYRFTRWAAGAPVLMVLSARLDFLVDRVGAHLQGTQYHLLDLGIAGEHFALRAAELGLGCCWIGWFDAKAAGKVLALPRRHRIVSLLALGWPAKDPSERPRKPRRELDDILEFR